MATEEEYLTFNQTVEKLGITEDELLNLVSGNQLRAFRIDRETKFRVQDVEKLCKEGGTVLAAQESVVLDFDDLPDDVQLVEEEVPLEEEPAPAAEDAPAEEMLEIAEEPAEELSLAEEPAMDFGAEEEGLSLAEESSTDSNPELEETVMTDSSEVAHTEELTIDDDNFDFSTQEVTIHEDAISDDEVAGEQTSVDETIPVEDDGEYEEEAPSASRRQYGRASGSASRRMTLTPERKGASVSDLVFTGVLMLLTLAMVYPAMLLGTVLIFGYTQGNDTILPGQLTWTEGETPNISKTFIPSSFQWIQDKDLKKQFGMATYGEGLDHAVDFKERLNLKMIKLDIPETAPAGGAAGDGTGAPAAGGGE